MAERVRALRLDDRDIAVPAGWVRRRWFWWLAGGIVSAVLLFGSRGHLNWPAAGLFAPATEVDSVTATLESTVEVVLDTTGYVAAGTVANVCSSISGTVVELNVKEGDQVAAGQVLGRLDDTRYRADLEQAQAGLALADARLEELRRGSREEDVEQAKAALEQAQARQDLVAKQLARAEQLRGTIAPAEFDRIEAGYVEAEARVDQLEQALSAVVAGARPEQIAALDAEVERARALVEKAQYFVDCTKLTSPVSGTVVERSAALGESVMPEAVTTTLFVIADVSRLDVEIDVQEQDLADVHLGQPCLVTSDAYPDREYSGRLEWFSPVFNRQRGIRRAKVRMLPPHETLMPDDEPLSDGQPVRLRRQPDKDPGGL